jgi:6-phosphofructokinase 2
MASIATLTMNPALDLSTATEKVVHTHKIRCGPPRFDPGGGGVNVARVVKELGGDVTLVYAAGGPHGVVLRERLDALGLAQRMVRIAQSTRENVTVDETSTGLQFRFVLPGPMLSEEEQRACLDALAALDPPPAFVVASGGLPPGADADALCAGIGRIAAALGAKLVLDLSLSMRHAPKGVYLMKPSESELSAMIGRPLDGLAEMAAAAQGLVAEGRSEVVVVSLGAKGALLVADGIEEHLPSPSVPVRSAVGAGDSMVGAIVHALNQGWSLVEAVRYGTAAGAATIMNPGTELCYRHDVERLYLELTSALRHHAGA